MLYQLSYSRWYRKYVKKLGVKEGRRLVWPARRGWMVRSWELDGAES